MKAIAAIITAFAMQAAAQEWAYNIDEYTYCKYNPATEEYNQECGTTKSGTTLVLRMDDSLMRIGDVVLVIDSTLDDKNSSGEFIRLFYGRDQQTREERRIIYSKAYINVGYPEKWLISYHVKNSDTSYVSGSAFGVNSRTIVTNYHVVAGMKSIVIKINEKFSYATILYSDSLLDLAILRTDSTIKSCKIDETMQEVGSDIIAYGFPNISLQGESIKATKGIISSKFGFKDDIKTYQIDAAIQTGNSGGPIASKNNIVGIVVSRLESGQNVNYAIKSVFIAAALKSVGIKNIGLGMPIDCTYLIIGSSH